MKLDDLIRKIWHEADNLENIAHILPTLESLPEFTGLANVSLIRGNNYSQVYLLNSEKGLAGKILQASRGILYARGNIVQLQKEAEYCAALLEARIAVPRPIGVYRVPPRFPFSFPRRQLLHSPKDSPLVCYGTTTPAVFVQEYVPGKTGEFTDDQWEIIFPLLNQELEKASASGFKPSRDALQNFIYQPEQKRVVLIDFGGWYEWNKN